MANWYSGRDRRLEKDAAMHARRCVAGHAAMRRECLEYGYTMAAVARKAGIHYSTVSKVIKRER